MGAVGDPVNAGDTVVASPSMLLFIPFNELVIKLLTKYVVAMLRDRSLSSMCGRCGLPEKSGPLMSAFSCI